MSDLPKCILCGAEPITRFQGALHPFANCPLDGSQTMTEEQWRKLMAPPKQDLTEHQIRHVMRIITALNLWLMYHRKEIGLPPNIVGATEEAILVGQKLVTGEL